jgi:hypothetical protein
MKYILSYIFFSLAIITCSIAPAQTLDWLVQSGTSGRENGYGVSADGLGNVYMAGYTTGSLAAPNAGAEDVFLSKYDSSGVLDWTRQIGVASVDESFAVKADGLGNIYITGVTGNLVGPPAGSNDGFLIKYDSTGTQQWARQLGTANIDQGRGVSVDGLGNVYISGYTTGSLAGPNAGGRDAFVRKYDSNGTAQWTRQFGTGQHDFSTGVSADTLGNVYLSGYTGGTLGGGPALASTDAFLVKYDATGSLQWTRQLGAAADEERGYAVDVDGTGNVYLSGMTSGNLGGTNQGFGDIFLTKYDSAGSQLWISQIGGTSYEEAVSVSFDGSNGVYVGGETLGDLFGSNPFSAMPDAIVAKFTDTGSFVWGEQISTSDADSFSSVSADGSGAVYASGNSSGNLAGHFGSSDAILAKFVPEPSSLLLVFGLVGGLAFKRP